MLSSWDLCRISYHKLTTIIKEEQLGYVNSKTIAYTEKKPLRFFTQNSTFE